MMKRSHLIYLVLIGVLVFTSFAPVVPVSAARTDVTKLTKVVIDNQSGMTATVQFNGPKKYSLTVKPGKTEVEMQSGPYRYELTSCGGYVKTGFQKLTGKQAKFKISVCKTSNIRIMNMSRTELRINLYGPVNYSYTVKPHATLRVKVLKGTFRYRAVWCGAAETGTIETHVKSYRWMFYDCGEEAPED